LSESKALNLDSDFLMDSSCFIFSSIAVIHDAAKVQRKKRGKKFGVDIYTEEAGNDSQLASRNP
jgi:hypothetical protein